MDYMGFIWGIRGVGIESAISLEHLAIITFSTYNLAFKVEMMYFPAEGSPLCSFY